MTAIPLSVRRALAATGLLVVAWAAPARGDTCGDCGPPSDAAFRDAIGGALRDTGDSPDTYGYEGGPCEVVVGPVRARRLGIEYLTAGTGTVWSCPSRTLVSRVVYMLRPGAQHEWGLTSASGGDLGSTIVAKMTEGAAQAGCPAAGAAQTLRIDSMVEAATCYFAEWDAWFELEVWEATADYAITRRFTWWVRNEQTGDLVLASGELDHLCEGGTASMRRLWPLQGMVEATPYKCSEPCTSKLSGVMVTPYLPTLPPPPPPPPTGAGGVRLSPMDPNAPLEPPTTEPAPTEPRTAEPTTAEPTTTEPVPTTPEGGTVAGGEDAPILPGDGDPLEPAPGDDPYPKNPADGTDSSPYPAESSS